MNYITKVKVQNFFSIKEEVVLDFSASKYSIDYNKDRLFFDKDKYTNKLLAFYGANASGKTTILKSIVWFSYFVSNTNQKEFPNAHSNIYADKDTPSYIELYFIHNKDEYIYKLDLNYDKYSNIQSLQNEVLQKKINDKYQTLFNREKEIFRNFEFEDNNSLLFDELSKNSSLLNESRSRMKDYHSLFDFFFNITMNSNISGTTQVDLNVDEHDERALTLALIDVTDLQKISKHLQKEFSPEFIEKSKKFKKFLFNTLSILGTDIKDSHVKIEMKDNTEIGTKLGLNHSVDIKKDLAFNLESNGTKMLIKLVYNIFESYQDSSILVLDELDSLVHPLIVPILNLLTIKLNIQMIYTTHNISNMRYLYNDEIYLIEKDKKHNTHIKILKDYDGYENFEKLYRNGALGGIPTIENINFDFISNLEK